MGMLDQEVIFSDAQVVTATGDTPSTNVYNTGGANGQGDAGQTGENLWINAFINTTVELASPGHPAGEAVMAHKTRCRRYFRALAEAAGLDDPDIISDQWMLLTEGATITALVEGDRAAASKARAGAQAILRGTLPAAA